jgi:hypothetical protein
LRQDFIEEGNMKIWEKQSRQRQQQVQKLQGGNKLGAFKIQEGHFVGRKWGTQWAEDGVSEAGRDWIHKTP